jgi:membrane associated rhomboid family serine protease
MVTMTIMAINIVIFVYITIADPNSLSGSRITNAQFDIGLFEPSLSVNGEWYRLVTSGFLHFGIIHIGFNMYLLYMLGQMLEPSLGRIRFLAVYMAGLLGGSAGAILLSDVGTVSGGASGAVFGLLGLAFVGYYMQGINPLNTSIGSLLMLNLFITFLFPRISIGGHLGGVAAGGLCALVMMAPRHKAYPRWMSYATPLAVSVLAVVISVVFVQ